MKYGVYRVGWEESEAGWGVRPDGCSFHATYDEGLQYIADRLARQRQFFREYYGDDRTPPEYDRPTSGVPKFIEVDEGMAKRVEKERNVWVNKFEERDLFK